MKPLKMDELWHLLPPLEELRPVLDLLALHSTPDPSRTWTGSGELDTVGGRLVDPEALHAHREALARRTQEHLAGLFEVVARVLSAAARGEREDAANCLLEAAALEEAVQRPDRARAWAQAAHRMSRDLKDRRIAATALRRWARASRTLGELEDARDGYRESFRVARDMDDAEGAAEAAVGTGNVLEEQGRWTEAETWYRKALETLDAADAGAVPQRWHALLNLHIVLRSQGRLDDCDGYLVQAGDIATALGDAAAAPFLENARGQRFMVSRDFPEAEERFRVGLEHAEGAVARITIRLNLAESLLAQERILDAAETAREAELDAISGGVRTRLPDVYRMLGRIAAQRGNPDTFVLFERALEIIRSERLPAVEEARTLQAYAEAEARRGEANAAAELRARALALYGELGIEHPRDPWSEYFSAPDEDPSHDGGSHG